MGRLMWFPIFHPDPEVVLLIELRGRLKRRHLKNEQWQRGCIKEVIKRLRMVRNNERHKD